MMRPHDTQAPPVQALTYAQRFQRDCSGGVVALIPEAGEAPTTHRFTSHYNPIRSNSPESEFTSD